jgi:hypothetical protein
MFHRRQADIYDSPKNKSPRLKESRDACRTTLPPSLLTTSLRSDPHSGNGSKALCCTCYPSALTPNILAWAKECFLVSAQFTVAKRRKQLPCPAYLSCCSGFIAPTQNQHCVSGLVFSISKC